MRNYIYSLIILVSSICFLSCTSTKLVEVPVETIKTEYITQKQRDSIFVHDSIDRIVKGDSVFQTVYKYVYRQSNKVDTVIQTDTITKVITVKEIETKEVNKIKWWQNILMYCGMLTIFYSAMVIYKKLRL